MLYFKKLVKEIQITRIENVNYFSIHFIEIQVSFFATINHDLS